jgi:hypothetical protein
LSGKLAIVEPWFSIPIYGRIHLEKNHVYSKTLLIYHISLIYHLPYLTILKSIFARTSSQEHHDFTATMSDDNNNFPSYDAPPAYSTLDPPSYTSFEQPPCDTSSQTTHNTSGLPAHDDYAQPPHSASSLPAYNLSDPLPSRLEPVCFPPALHQSSTHFSTLTDPGYDVEAAASTTDYRAAANEFAVHTQSAAAVRRNRVADVDAAWAAEKKVMEACGCLVFLVILTMVICLITYFVRHGKSGEEGGAGEARVDELALMDWQGDLDALNTLTWDQIWALRRRF